MEPEELAQIVAKLNEAQEILDKLARETMESMDISEFNQTPIGRAMIRIGNAIDLIEDLET